MIILFGFGEVQPIPSCPFAFQAYPFAFLPATVARSPDSTVDCVVWASPL